MACAASVDEARFFREQVDTVRLRDLHDSFVYQRVNEHGGRPIGAHPVVSRQLLAVIVRPRMLHRLYRRMTRLTQHGIGGGS